jgi:predicted PurR-regulated permease PerM
MERQAQFATVVMGVIAIVFALIASRDISAPIVLALAVGVVLSPLGDLWRRLGVHAAAGAILTLLVTLALLAGMVVLFQPVVLQLVATAPKVWADLQFALQGLRDIAKGMSNLSADVTGALSSAPVAEGEDEGMSMPTVTDALLLAPAIAGQVLTFAGTLFFFILGRDQIYDWISRRLSEPSNRAVTAQRLLASERMVSRYFLTVTTVNAGLGIATGAALQALGVPGAAMWGLLAFFLNFIVYLGPGLLVAALLFAGIGAFDGFMVLAPAAVFILLNFLESQFVTPTLVGRNLELNPLLVFLTLIFGIWVWGAVGGVVAIPLLLYIRVLVTGATGNGPESRPVTAPPAAAAD